jgi:hypothetical protein
LTVEATWGVTVRGEVEPVIKPGPQHGSDQGYPGCEVRIGVSRSPREAARWSNPRAAIRPTEQSTRDLPKKIGGQWYSPIFPVKANAPLRGYPSGFILHRWFRPYDGARMIRQPWALSVLLHLYTVAHGETGVVIQDEASP